MQKGKKTGMQMEQAKDFRGAMGKLFTYLGDYKGEIAAAVFFAMMGTGFQIVGPRLMGNVTSVIFEGVQNASREGTISIDFTTIAVMISILVGVYVLSSLSGIFQGYFMTGVSQKLTYRLRKEISRKLNRLPMSYFESRTHGEILSRITNDVDTLSQSLNQSAIQAISAATTLLGIVLMMLFISPLMTLIALLILPISGGVVSMIVKRSQKYFKEQQERLGKVNGQIEEIYGGHSIVAAFNKEDDVIETFERENDRLAEAALKSQFLSGLMMPVMQFISNLGYVAVVIVGGFLAVRQVIMVGDIQAFVQYIRNFTQPIQQVAQVMNLLQSTAAATERVFEVLEAPEEEEGNTEKELQGKLRGQVTFEHVSFGYSEKKMVINDFNAVIQPGSKVAIVGPTGAGKTTIVKLLMRFYDVKKGCIRVDGRDIRQYNREEMRSHMGMVLQDTWLFKGSIMENIRYGRLEAGDEEVIRAAQAAYVDNFVRMLPGGYQMELNEEVTNVSQGQKQLMTIARAILADSSILILDEATSSVDTRTEEKIQKAMDNLMRGRTSFIIAHRLSTIKNADLILVMREGDIVEKGTHQELLDCCGFYAELYHSQFSGGI